MKRNRKAAGISLVALVITIIVLIILTGAVIVTFMEGGIIDRVKESVFKNDMRTYQEILALKRAENQMEIALGEKEDVEINASTLEEIQEIIPEFKEEYEGIVVITKGELSIGEKVTGDELSSSQEQYATWLSDLGIGLSRLPSNAIANFVQVGDYVTYTPDGTTTSYNLLGTDSGYAESILLGTYTEGDDLEDQTIERQNINWRVLKNDGRQVTLISETPIDNIGLCGTQGFLNGPYLLDDIYNNLYSGSKGTARNLKQEDVNEALNVTIGADVKPAYYGINGEVKLEAGATFGDAIDDAGVDVSSWNMPDNKYRDYELTYSYSGSTYREGHEMEYDLIYKGNYWLSSSCVSMYLDINIAEFYMRKLLEFCRMYYIEGIAEGSKASGRPIVILNSDVEVVNPSVGGDTAETAWKLK